MGAAGGRWVNVPPNPMGFYRRNLYLDTTLIMEKIYVFNIKDEKTLEALIKWYSQRSRTVTYVREGIMQLYRQRKLEKYEIPKQWSLSVAQPLVDLVCNRPVEVPG